MTKRKINAAIRHTGLTIQHNRGDGYSYFTDAQGNQVGGSVYVCYLYQQSLAQWVQDAEAAARKGNNLK